MISVIMPTYNRPDYIQRAIDSFNNQDYEDKELIIVNDGGDELIDGYNIPHVGQASAVNYGIDKANGDYICLLHDDDELTENSLSVRMDEFYTGIDFVYGKHIQIRTKNNIESKKEFDIVIPDVSDIRNVDDICTGSIMWRKSAHLKIGYFDNHYKSYHDTKFKYNLLKNLNCIMVDEFVYKYYRHNDSESSRNSKNGVWKKEEKELLKEYAE